MWVFLFIFYTTLGKAEAIALKGQGREMDSFAPIFHKSDPNTPSFKGVRDFLAVSICRTDPTA